MGLFAASSNRNVAVPAAIFDWAGWKPARGKVEFLNLRGRVTASGNKVEFTQSMGTGGPFLSIYVDADSDALSQILAGYTLDKADMESLTIKTYEGRYDKAEKVKLTARNFTLRGFPTVADAEKVKAITVKGTIA